MNEANRKLPDIDEETKEAVEYYFSNFYGTEEIGILSDINNKEGLYKNENTVSVSFVSDSMIHSKLVFENLNVKAESYISREDDKYYMTVETLYGEDIYLSFSCVTVEKTNLKDIEPDYFLNYPWNRICNISSYISLRNQYELNKKEKEIYELASFLDFLNNPLSDSLFFEKPEVVSGADIFSSLCDKYGFKDFYKCRLILFSDAKPNKKAVETNKLLYKLNNIKYKPFFDEIHSLLTDSQKEYPTLAQLCADNYELADKREKITKILTHYGYKGEYPEFYKDGKLLKTKTVQSYGQIYTLIKNSPARFFIRVIEDYSIDTQELSFKYLCATHIKRKKESFSEKASDCLFFDKGHRVYDIFTDFDYDDSEENKISLDFLTHIAVKKAELIPLSKEESLRINGRVPFPFLLFIIMAVIGSVFFGGLFTPAMMLMTFIIEGEMVIELMWWLKFGIAAGLSFGFLFSLVMALLYKFSGKRR